MRHTRLATGSIHTRAVCNMTTSLITCQCHRHRCGASDAWAPNPGSMRTTCASRAPSPERLQPRAVSCFQPRAVSCFELPLLILQLFQRAFDVDHGTWRLAAPYMMPRPSVPFGRRGRRRSSFCICICSRFSAASSRCRARLTGSGLTTWCDAAIRPIRLLAHASELKTGNTTSQSQKQDTSRKACPKPGPKASSKGTA